MLIIGHKSPDTDSVVSAIVWADIQKKLGKEAIPGVAGKINNETSFVLDHFGVALPKEITSIADKEVFLVDHNSFDQSPDGGQQAKLLGCLDHHLLSGVKSTEPTYFRCEPVGSTSTLVASFAFEKDIELNRVSAGLLAAGLISDTFNLTSPTTTEQDRKVLQKLTKLSGIDVEEFAKKMFEAKSSLKGISISEIVSKDYKEFEFNGIKFGFGVWETVLPDPVLEKKKEIKEAVVSLKEKNKMDHMFFAVVDILKQQSFIITPGAQEETITKEVLGGETKEELIFLKSIVSRKKQMIPPLGEYFEKLR